MGPVQQAYKPLKETVAVIPFLNHYVYAVRAPRGASFPSNIFKNVK